MRAVSIRAADFATDGRIPSSHHRTFVTGAITEYFAARRNHCHEYAFFYLFNGV